MQNYAMPCRDKEFLVNDTCDGTKCHLCGWNPKVERERKQQMYYLCQEKKLRTWGKEPQKPVTRVFPAVVEERQPFRLIDLLEHICIENVEVFLWRSNGSCLYTGGAGNALLDFGMVRVLDWHMDEDRLQVDIA